MCKIWFFVQDKINLNYNFPRNISSYGISYILWYNYFDAIRTFGWEQRYHRSILDFPPEIFQTLSYFMVHLTLSWKKLLRTTRSTPESCWCTLILFQIDWKLGWLTDTRRTPKYGNKTGKIGFLIWKALMWDYILIPFTLQCGL